MELLSFFESNQAKPVTDPNMENGNKGKVTLGNYTCMWCLLMSPQSNIQFRRQVLTPRLTLVCRESGCRELIRMHWGWELHSRAVTLRGFACCVCLTARLHVCSVSVYHLKEDVWTAATSHYCTHNHAQSPFNPVFLTCACLHLCDLK